MVHTFQGGARRRHGADGRAGADGATIPSHCSNSQWDNKLLWELTTALITPRQRCAGNKRPIYPYIIALPVRFAAKNLFALTCAIQNYHCGNASATANEISKYRWNRLYHGVLIHISIYLYVPHRRCNSRIWIWGDDMGISCFSFISIGITTKRNFFNKESVIFLAVRNALASFRYISYYRWNRPCHVPLPDVTFHAAVPWGWCDFSPPDVTWVRC